MIVLVNIWTTFALEINVNTKDTVILREIPAVLYENTIPLSYELHREDDGSKTEDTDSTDNFKWSQCFQNTTCYLERILNKYSADTEVHISQIIPHFPETPIKAKRFSPIQWILHACCQVATTDDTDELFHSHSILSNQVEKMKLAIHDDHRDLAQSLTNIQSMTKQFNAVTNQAKHALAETLIQTKSLEEREGQLVKNLIKIYSHIDHLTKQTKLAAATSVCQSKFIPPQIITPSILKADLLHLQDSLTSHNWTLAIPVLNLGRYYSIPIARCIISNKQIAVRVKIPITRASNPMKLYSVKSTYFANDLQTCSKTTPSLKVISSGRHQKFHWFRDETHCQPETNSMCFVPRDMLANPADDVTCADCPTICTNSSKTIVASKGDDSFIITNPPKTITVSCQDKSTLISLPDINHGFLEVKIPCRCAVTWDDNLLDTGFPCEAQWTASNLTLSHIIPNHWIPVNDSVLTSLLNNSSMTYSKKIESVLNATWELTQKPVQLSPEVLYQETYYNKIKSAAQDVHIEWSAIITILIFLILFRAPINALLVRVISAGTAGREKKRQASEQKISSLLDQHEEFTRTVEMRMQKNFEATTKLLDRAIQH